MGCRWSKALLRVVVSLEVHEELERDRGSANSLWLVKGLMIKDLNLERF